MVYPPYLWWFGEGVYGIVLPTYEFTRHWARGFQAQFDEYLPPKRNVNWTCKNLGFRILTGKIHQLLSIGCWNDSGTTKRMLQATKTQCSQGIAAWARDGSKILHPKKWGCAPNSRSFTNSKLEIHQPSIGVKFWLGKMECLKPEKDQWPRLRDNCRLKQQTWVISQERECGRINNHLVATPYVIFH